MTKGTSRPPFVDQLSERQAAERHSRSCLAERVGNIRNPDALGIRWNEACYRLSVPRDDDDLPFFDFFEEVRQMRLGLVRPDFSHWNKTSVRPV